MPMTEDEARANSFWPSDRLKGFAKSVAADPKRNVFHENEAVRHCNDSKTPIGEVACSLALDRLHGTESDGVRVTKLPYLVKDPDTGQYGAAYKAEKATGTKKQ